MTKINIIGGGLAGSESAWQLAKRGFEVEIFEMRNETIKTFAHQTSDLAELVCSNSLRSDDIKTAIGILHQEMRILDSLVMRSADKNSIPAGSALAVDRKGFSKMIEEELLKTNKVKITRQEISNIKLDEEENDIWIIASGPLTSNQLNQQIIKYSKQENLAFFDAIAPIIFKDSINFDIAWFQSRYDKGSGKDYINCPLNEEQYEKFIKELLDAEKTEFKEWEKSTPYFDGCLPIEIMAERGYETLRYGPMKPIGLSNPHFPPTPPKKFNRPFAVVQLRQDNHLGTIYNMVGFQTKLKYNEQQRIFRMIPGLENAEFARLGGIHRNNFINSPKLLDNFLRFKGLENIRFAGQITGVEGYVESASMGLLAGIFTAYSLANKKVTPPNNKTAIGSLLNHITGGHCGDNFQPMNVNFGLFHPCESHIKKDQRKQYYSDRAINEIKIWQEANLN